MKDMREAAYVLGVKIHRDRSKRLLALSQETYIRKILKRFNMQNCNPIDTPIAKGEGLNLKMCPKTPDEKREMANVPYSNVIGCLMYAMMCTRPDICYAVGLVSRYQANPGKLHWKAVKRILRYLKGTADYSLCYQGDNLRLSGYSDADWSGDLDERKSTSGYVFLLNNGAISWRSKKQICTALSTMEAEFIACSATVQEAVWLRRFLQSLGVIVSAAEPVTVHCDSQAAIAYVKDPKYHGSE
ncbi:secreted RxLR effector protein 161-like [Phoenix dactylifera]|uniref:Secreted RxLR effector protein 161-like n=1 Tax=Phoenix dactylifera TaxID=42345 RepID=A0A8B8ZY55_PHODC|nr:secreted RxLR effector protein 161-like [Phoenix dactylifera]